MKDYKRLYEEAVKAIKELSDSFDNESLTKELERIFPVLKKNREEKIKKSLVLILKSQREHLTDFYSTHDVYEEELVNWIEEQKSSYQPKFKVGDLVVHDISDGRKVVRQIVNMTNKSYILNGECFNTFYFNDLENDYHLWTIEDAKPGDVLAGNECYVIFKEIDGLNIKCFCTYHFMGYNPELYIDTLQNKTAFKPATKEQCEALLKAVEKSGHIWDAEKLELRKIEEQKPITYNEKKIYWSEEDEKMVSGLVLIVENWYNNQSEKEKEYYGDCGYTSWLKSLKDRVQLKQEWKQENTDDLTDFENVMMHIGGSFFGENAGLDPNDTNAIKEQANILLGLVPKQEWSEDDEMIYQHCLTILHDYGYDTWLKSFKDRIQPNRGWSFEDECNQAWVVEMLYGLEDEDKEYEKKCRDMAEWLKSLNNKCFPLKPKMWSEEDENFLKEAIKMIEMPGSWFKGKDLQNKIVNWLKSLKPQKINWIPVNKDIYIEKPVLARMKDKSGVFKGYVLCADHTLDINIYEKYIRLSDILK